MIYIKKKAQGTLLKEFNSFVMPKIEAAAVAVNKHPSVYLIDDLLEPYVNAYVTMKKQSYSSNNSIDGQTIVYGQDGFYANCTLFEIMPMHRGAK